MILYFATSPTIQHLKTLKKIKVKGILCSYVTFNDANGVGIERIKKVLREAEKEDANK